MSFIILGVHPVESTQPSHLLEVEWTSDAGIYDWNEVTQEVENQPRRNWQAVYDEQPLSESRWVFFFHYLDWDKPLLTPDGPMTLPPPSPLPSHLQHIEYVEAN